MSKKSNPVIENILSRRSIRRYDPAKEVPGELRELLIECACAAPSAHNYRPWHFIVVDGRERLDTLAKIHPYGKMLSSATLAIIVCGMTRGEAEYTYWEEDCSAAMQNILLAARSVGLGSVWLGVRHSGGGLEDKLKGMFGIPADAAVLGIAAIGYPLTTRDPHKGIDAHAVHTNKW